jgi:hypothetical protein
MEKEVNSNWIAKLRQWIRNNIGQEVPDELSRCEFDCNRLECSQGEWENCERRKAQCQAKSDYLQ